MKELKSMERDFKGIWIPKEIWLDEELTIIEKIVLVEIDSLDGKHGCYASNEHFANFLSISKGRASQIINSLKEKGYIKVQLIRGENKQIQKRIIKSNLKNTLFNKLNRVPSKTKDPIVKNYRPSIENDEESNTTEEYKESKRIVSSTLQENNQITNEIKEQIMNAWNDLGLQELVAINSNTNRYSLLKARINDSSLDDILKGIQKIKESPFLQGNNDKGWTVTFDWFIKPNNFIKVLEGNYDVREKVQKIEKKNDYKNKFHNFKQRTDDYTDEDIEALARKKRKDVFKSGVI